MPNRRQWLRDRITQHRYLFALIVSALVAAAVWFSQSMETPTYGTITSLPTVF